MAFANLFTGLSSMEEDVRSCGQAASARTLRRNETECGTRGRKRKAQGEQSHPHKKIRCGAQMMHNTESEHSSFVLSKEMIHGNRDQAGHNNWCQKGQNYKTKNNRNVNKQQQKNQHQHKNGGRPGCRGGSHQTRPPWRKEGRDRNKNQKQDLEVKRTRFMSQEFKDQNALLVDGRLLCRHFIWGRCIKGDGCQLEHTQGYNDLVKEMCKFYVQGLCTKGSSCPYMHKSFPCKFFHRKGKCSQGADCRFSHEPLNDVTSQLLDEALKRDNDLYELAKKAEQEPSGEPATADEAETTDTNRTPDILLQPVRASFYKSTDTNAEEEAFLCQTDKLSDSMEEAVTPQASGAVQPHSPPSSNPNGEEPVCYSVEAVLGPQLSRPFPNFFTTPRSQESSPLSSSNCTSGSANQSRIPYSLHDVLRSSTFGYTPTPPTAQTESYPPKTHFEEVIDPLLRPQTPKETVYLVNASNEASKPQEKMFKSLSSPHVHTGLISKTRPSLALTSGDHMKQDGNMPESVKPVQRASKHPSQLKPHLSVLTCDSRASSKPICATSGFTEFKGKAALKPVTSSIKLSDSANLVSCHFETKQPRKIQSGLKLGTKQHSDETTAGCSCKMAYCGGLAVGCKETVKRPFHSLFASPISDTLQHIDDSETGSCIPQSARPPPQSADCTSNHLKSALEPDKASARSFLSLFAAPLGAAPRTSPCSQLPVQLGDIASHLSDAKQRASNLEKSIPQQVRSDVKEISNAPRFLNSSPNPKIDNKNRSAGHRKPCPEQLVNPVCSLVSESLSEMSAGPSRTCSYQQQPDMSSHKAGPASADSVLKTLFACLRPYQGDGEQEDGVHISVPSESEKTDRGGLGCVFVKPQQKSKKKRRRKKTLKTQDSHKQSTEEAAADSAQHHLLSPASLQTPQISLETPGRFTLSSSGTTESQVRDSGAHDLPFKPALLMHHARPRLKHTPEERELINGDVADTPFKELFKTLDTTVFHPRC